MDKNTIMVVDDTPIIRNIIKKALEGGYNIVEAENGTEAINKLNEIGFNVSGMFLDLNMPVSNGYVVLDTLKSLGISIPTTVISGDDTPETINTVCNHYGVGYINKPLSITKIQEVANTMCFVNRNSIRM